MSIFSKAVDVITGRTTELTLADLGMTVRDRVSGYTGVATSWHDTYSGVAQIGVTSRVKDDGSYGDAMSFDLQQLEIVGDRAMDMTMPAPHSFAIGDTVTDNVTGASGVIVEFSTFLNGCVHVSAQPKVDKDGKVPERFFWSVNRIALKEKAPAAPAEKPTRGGPVRKVVTR